jgi:hypothetical protein
VPVSDFANDLLKRKIAIIEGVKWVQARAAKKLRPQTRA